jgi:hypothetical protein
MYNFLYFLTYTIAAIHGHALSLERVPPVILSRDLAVFGTTPHLQVLVVFIAPELGFLSLLQNQH